MKVSVRKTDDYFGIMTLHKDIFPGDEYPSLNTLICWKAYVENVEAGFCTVNILPSEDGVLFFSRAGVKKEFRGHGIHKRMIRVREMFAKRNGFHTIITYVIKENVGSFVHLIKDGYKIYEPNYKYAGDVFYFIKEIG